MERVFYTGLANSHLNPIKRGNAGVVPTGAPVEAKIASEYTVGMLEEADFATRAAELREKAAADAHPLARSAFLMLAEIYDELSTGVREQAALQRRRLIRIVKMG